MPDQTKNPMPAYATAASFTNLINDLRETGIPSHVTRSVVKGSNSGKATMLASLKSLGLIKEDGAPTEKLTDLVKDKENFKKNLTDTLKSAYPYLFDGSINLATTATEKVAEKFKSAGAGGSTVSKAMAFFLTLAKEAGIEISTFVKAPPPTRPSNGGKGKAKKIVEQNNDELEPDDIEENHEGMIKIPIPLHGLEDGAIYLPEQMTKKQWEYAKKMASFILDNYHQDFSDDT